MTTIHWDGRKWPDRLHWQFDLTRLGEDEYGTWAHLASGATAQRGHEAPRTIRDGFVGLIRAETWWTAEFYWSHPRHLVYVNIGTPVRWDGDRVGQIDLDLDVVRNLDGSIEILDEDEFLDHRVRYEYPPQLVDGARTAAAQVVGMLERSDEPFGSAPQRWIDVARSG